MANTKLKPVRMIGNNLSDAETTGSIYMVAEKSLTPSEDINMYNQVEIVELKKHLVVELLLRQEIMNQMVQAMKMMIQLQKK